MTKRIEPFRPGPWIALIGISLALAILAIYQWRELIVVRSGGDAACAINEAVNCVTVWNAPFASAVHRATSMPLAAWGLVWALTALALSIWAMLQARRGSTDALALRSLQVTAAVGILSCFVLAFVSVQTGSLCPTCLATYVGVIAFGYFVLKVSRELGRPSVADLIRGASVAAVVTVGLYLALLVPAKGTPNARPGAETLAEQKTGPRQSSPEDDARELQRVVSNMSPDEKQSLARSFFVYQTSPVVDRSLFPVREQSGPIDAPVKVLEFTDMRCGHCREFVATMKQLKRIVPQGRLSVEPRHFPLDSECNNHPDIKHSDNTGIRCLGAKVQICLEGRPDFWDLQSKLFEAQDTLTKQRVIEIGASGSMSRSQLESCVKDPKTTAKLNEDVALAGKYGIQGTPLVIVNGRKATMDPTFLYVMALAKGDTSSPAFAQLPIPQHRGP